MESCLAFVSVRVRSWALQLRSLSSRKQQAVMTGTPASPVKTYWLHVLRNGTKEPYTFTLLLTHGMGRPGLGENGAGLRQCDLTWDEVRSRLTAVGLKLGKIAEIGETVHRSGDTF